MMRRNGSGSGRAVRGGLLQTGEVGVDDCAVAIQGEDQRHVHADALGDGRGNGRQARFGGRDLDQRVGSVDDLPQVRGLRGSGLGIHGEVGIDSIETWPSTPPEAAVAASTSQASARRRSSAP